MDPMGLYPADNILELIPDTVGGNLGNVCIRCRSGKGEKGKRGLDKGPGSQLPDEKTVSTRRVVLFGITALTATALASV